MPNHSPQKSKLTKSQMQKLRQQGWSMKKIGDKAGISRQRVSQILDSRSRQRGAPPLSCEVIRSALRPTHITSWSAAGRESHHFNGALKRGAKRYGFYEAAERLFRIRLKAERRGRIIRSLRVVSLEVGHTPSANDMGQTGRVSRDMIRKWTGGMRAAQKLAGLPPNPIGHPRKDRARAS